MMKKFIILFMCTLLLAGCSQTNGESPNDTTQPGQGVETPEETRQETVYYRSLALENAPENAVGAVVYLGNGEGSMDGFSWLESGLYQSLASAQWEAIAALDLGGEETYLIVPRYENTTVTIAEQSMEESTGELKETGNTKSFQTPVTISCNPSDLFSNVLVSITAGENDTVAFQPYFSLRDGNLVTDPRVPSILSGKAE